MTTKTMTLGRNSLLSLHRNLEIKITKLVNKRKTKLFCKKHEELITPKFSIEHECLKPKRIYTNKEGKQVVIFCPHLMTLKGEPFYKVHESIIYESLEGIWEITTKFKHKPASPEKEKEDIFTKHARNLTKIIHAGKVLTGET